MIETGQELARSMPSTIVQGSIDLSMQQSGSALPVAQLQGCLLFDDVALSAEALRARYEAAGMSMINRCKGEYAFALWDGSRLFCGRDRLGRVPFYYRAQGKIIYFSSDLRWLVSCTGYDRQVEESALARMLIGDFTDQELTLYRGILRLPAAHTLTFDSNGLRLCRYWAPEEVDESRSSFDEAAAEFRGLLATAVRRQRSPSGPTGIFLSGGIDSSAITCLASRDSYPLQGGAAPLSAAPSPAFSNPQSLISYSLLFDDPECDNRCAIAEVAGAAGSALRTLFPERAPELLRLGKGPPWDETHYHPALAMFLPGMEAARRDGVCVMLTGWGADEILTPPFSHCADLLARAKFRDCFREIQCRRETGVSPLAMGWEFGLKPLLPLAFRRAARSIIPRKPPPWLDRDFCSRVEVFERIAESYKKIERRFASYARQYLYQRLCVSGAMQTSFEQETLFTAGSGIELRSPFFDDAIVDFAFRARQEHLYWRGQNKIILRHAMSGVLPEDLRYRLDNSDLTSFVTRIIKLQDVKFDSLLQGSVLASRGYISKNGLAELRSAVRAGREMNTFLSIISLENWIRRLT